MSRNNPKSKPTDAKNPTGHIRNYKQVGCGGRLKWVYVVAYNEKSSGDFYLYEDLQPIPENTQFEEILSNNLFEI